MMNNVGKKRSALVNNSREYPFLATHIQGLACKKKI